MSTHDAFSLPTSSPITSSHHASFARSAVETPDSDPASSSSYAYPPPSTSSPTTYDYVPRMKYVWQFDLHINCSTKISILQRETTLVTVTATVSTTFA